MTDQLREAIIRALDYVQRAGVEVDSAILDGIKAPLRDSREPGRKRKMKFERKLELLMRRIFGKQAAQVEQHLGTVKAISDYLDWFDIDPEDESDLVMLFTLAAQDGVNLFGERIGIGFDPTATNAEAAKWARKYTGKFIDGINKTTAEAISKAVASFVETEGMTIGDVMKLLPFGDDRALTIAVTEITRAYAESNQLAGVELAKEYPDVKVVKTWFTNNDDLVCPICGPLDGKTVPIDSGWGENGQEDEEGILQPPAHVNCRCWTDYSTDIRG